MARNRRRAQLPGELQARAGLQPEERLAARQPDRQRLADRDGQLRRGHRLDLAQGGPRRGDQAALLAQELHGHAGGRRARFDQPRPALPRPPRRQRQARLPPRRAVRGERGLRQRPRHGGLRFPHAARRRHQRRSLGRLRAGRLQRPRPRGRRRRLGLRHADRRQRRKQRRAVQPPPRHGLRARVDHGRHARDRRLRLRRPPLRSLLRPLSRRPLQAEDLRRHGRHERRRLLELHVAHGRLRHEPDGRLHRRNRLRARRAQRRARLQPGRLALQSGLRPRHGQVHDQEHPRERLDHRGVLQDEVHGHRQRGRRRRHHARRRRPGELRRRQDLHRHARRRERLRARRTAPGRERRHLLGPERPVRPLRRPEEPDAARQLPAEALHGRGHRLRGRLGLARTRHGAARREPDLRLLARDRLPAGRSPGGRHARHLRGRQLHPLRRHRPPDGPRELRQAGLPRHRDERRRRHDLARLRRRGVRRKRAVRAGPEHRVRRRPRGARRRRGRRGRQRLHRHERHREPRRRRVLRGRAVHGHAVGLRRARLHLAERRAVGQLQRQRGLRLLARAGLGGRPGPRGRTRGALLRPLLHRLHRRLDHRRLDHLGELQAVGLHRHAARPQPRGRLGRPGQRGPEDLRAVADLRVRAEHGLQGQVRLRRKLRSLLGPLLHELDRREPLVQRRRLRRIRTAALPHLGLRRRARLDDAQRLLDRGRARAVADLLLDPGPGLRARRPDGRRERCRPAGQFVHLLERDGGALHRGHLPLGEVHDHRQPLRPGRVHHPRRRDRRAPRRLPDLHVRPHRGDLPHRRLAGRRSLEPRRRGRRNLHVLERAGRAHDRGRGRGDPALLAEHLRRARRGRHGRVRGRRDGSARRLERLLLVDPRDELDARLRHGQRRARSRTSPRTRRSWSTSGAATT